jgi:hypothetical protein
VVIKTEEDGDTIQYYIHTSTQQVITETVEEHRTNLPAPASQLRPLSHQPEIIDLSSNSSVAAVDDDVEVESSVGYGTQQSEDDEIFDDESRELRPEFEGYRRHETAEDREHYQMKAGEIGRDEYDNESSVDNGIQPEEEDIVDEEISQDHETQSEGGEEEAPHQFCYHDHESYYAESRRLRAEYYRAREMANPDDLNDFEVVYGRETPESEVKSGEFEAERYDEQYDESSYDYSERANGLRVPSFRDRDLEEQHLEEGDHCPPYRSVEYENIEDVFRAEPATGGTQQEPFVISDSSPEKTPEQSYEDEDDSVLEQIEEHSLNRSVGQGSPSPKRESARQPAASAKDSSRFDGMWDAAEDDLESVEYIEPSSIHDPDMESEREHHVSRHRFHSSTNNVDNVSAADTSLEVSALQTALDSQFVGSSFSRFTHATSELGEESTLASVDVEEATRDQVFGEMKQWSEEN